MRFHTRHEKTTISLIWGLDLSRSCLYQNSPSLHCQKVSLDSWENVDRFQTLISTQWEVSISISVGLDSRDPQAYTMTKLLVTCIYIFLADCLIQNTNLTAFDILPSPIGSISLSDCEISCQNMPPCQVRILSLSLSICPSVYLFVCLTGLYNRLKFNCCLL